MYRPTPTQERALEAAARWFHHPEKRRRPFRLFGYAGTGKSECARWIAKRLVPGGQVEFAAFTGKAASVMEARGWAGARTIHNLCCRPSGRTPPDEDHPNGTLVFVQNTGSDILKAKLVVIDECSMVDHKLGTWLESYGVPVLVLGDPAQLPPVRGKGYFTPEGIPPDILLTEIIRQGAGSAIVDIATKIRMGERLPEIGDHGNGDGAVQIARAIGNRDVLSVDQILVGCHRTRRPINANVRKALGFGAPSPRSGRNWSACGMIMAEGF